MRKRIIIISLIMILIEGLLIFTHKPKKEYKVINKTQPISMEVKIEKRKLKMVKSVKTSAQKSKKTLHKSQSDGTYKLTHYGYDCCKSGKTATGWDARNIWYNDSEYGSVRIVAMCSKIPMYSIVRIYNYKITGGNETAIVLDRGVGCSTIDLLVENERTSSKYGIQKNVKVEVLRSGK